MNIREAWAGVITEGVSKMNAIRFAVVALGGLIAASSALASARGYVTDYNTGNIAVIDTASNTLVPNSLNVGTGAWSVAIGSNDRAYFYSSDGVSVVDTQALIVLQTIPLSQCTNDSVLALDASETLLYVGCNPAEMVLAVDLQSGQVVDSLSIPSAWFVDLLTDASGTQLVVAEYGMNQVHLLGVSPSLSLSASLPANVNGTNGIDLEGVNNRVYIPTWAPNELTVVDPVASSIGTTIAAAGWHVSVDPGAAQRAYQLAPNGDVTAIDTASETVLATFSTGSGNYFSSAVHPTDGRLYLLNQTASQIEVYDPASQSLLDTISLPGFVEPRLVGRWMAAGPVAAAPPAIGVPVFSGAPWGLILFSLLALLLAWPYVRSR
ncbi:MAG: YncE family protein [Wenzhouxiangella sp.]